MVRLARQLQSGLPAAAIAYVSFPPLPKQNELLGKKFGIRKNEDGFGIDRIEAPLALLRRTAQGSLIDAVCSSTCNQLTSHPSPRSAVVNSLASAAPGEMGNLQF